MVHDNDNDKMNPIRRERIVQCITIGNELLDITKYPIGFTYSKEQQQQQQHNTTNVSSSSPVLHYFITLHDCTTNS